MIKIITAIGNPNLNYNLRKYDEFEIFGSDIQYKDGVLESLEINNEIDFIIISEFLEGTINLEELIDSINLINKKIKIIVILSKKDKEYEELLMSKGIYDVLYDKADSNEIVNLLKNKNIEIINKELRDEIDKLKELIYEKNNKNNIKSIFKKSKNMELKNNNFINKKINKIICITGNNGVGKSSLLYLLSSLLAENNKILIMDFSTKNNIINPIFYSKKYVDFNEKEIKKYIEKNKNNVDIFSYFNYLKL